MANVCTFLGWDTEQLPFSDTFEPLGVTVDPKSSVSSIVTIRNKASRIQELEMAETAAVRAGSISGRHSGGSTPAASRDGCGD